jgi:hypothetical protein
MRACLSLALVALLPTAALTQDAPTNAMTAAEFDAYATGKTLTYTQYGEIYGTEEYLPNRRVRWQVTGDLCQYGHWFEKGDLICFTYEYSQGEYCWTFWQDEGGLKALSTDDLPGEELSEVQNSYSGLDCPDLDVGV